MHIHPWNTPPLNGETLTTDLSYIHNLPPDLVVDKLENVYRKFAECGLRPRSFRGGRYSSGPEVQKYLQGKGFVADASVLPFTSWAESGAPDYRQRDLAPRRIGRLAAAGAALWEIPLTLGFTRGPYQFWRRMFELVERSPLRYGRMIGIADRLNLVRRVWLNFEDPLGNHMIQFLHKLRRLDLPYVCFTVHSSSLQVGANGSYTRSADERERLFRRVDQVLRLMNSWSDFKPATISEITNHLEEEHHASTGN